MRFREAPLRSGKENLFIWLKLRDVTASISLCQFFKKKADLLFRSSFPLTWCDGVSLRKLIPFIIKISLFHNYHWEVKMTFRCVISLRGDVCVYQCVHQCVCVCVDVRIHTSESLLSAVLRKMSVVQQWGRALALEWVRKRKLSAEQPQTFASQITLTF